MTDREFAIYLVRASLDTYLKTGELISFSRFKDIPDMFLSKKGAFVSLKDKDKHLRGCIGTIEAVSENLACEIIVNAVKAGTKDPRFPQVTTSEFPSITVSVDIINPLEQVRNTEELDPHKLGIIVGKERQTGVLLPDLPGIDTVTKQVKIACQKAGFEYSPDVKIYKFEVTRFNE